MNAPTIFYAWQSDRPRESTRDIVYHAIGEAVHRVGSQMAVEASPRIDHDTLNESGTPPITETIYRKIKNAAIFVGDVTFICDIQNQKGEVKKKIPNPNVLVELGYADASIGWNRIILVLNEHYGSTKWLPFDLKNRRFPITYKLGPESEKRADKTECLAKNLEEAIRWCLSAEYDLAARCKGPF